MDVKEVNKMLGLKLYFEWSSIHTIRILKRRRRRCRGWTNQHSDVIEKDESVFRLTKIKLILNCEKSHSPSNYHFTYSTMRCSSSPYASQTLATHCWSGLVGRPIIPEQQHNSLWSPDDTAITVFVFFFFCCCYCSCCWWYLRSLTEEYEDAMRPSNTV